MKKKNINEKEVKNCLELRKKLLETSQKLTCCELEERELYEELCLVYSNRLKELNIKLNNEYGILSCLCQNDEESKRQ